MQNQKIDEHYQSNLNQESKFELWIKEDLSKYKLNQVVATNCQFRLARPLQSVLSTIEEHHSDLHRFNRIGYDNTRSEPYGFVAKPKDADGVSISNIKILRMPGEIPFNQIPYGVSLEETESVADGCRFEPYFRHSNDPANTLSHFA